MATAVEQALIDAQALFASGDFDMGSDAALMAAPMNRSRPDLWDDQGNYTGVSYFDTYASHRGDGTEIYPNPPVAEAFLSGEARGVVDAFTDPIQWDYIKRLVTPERTAEPIESTALVDALAARDFFDSPLGEQRGHMMGGRLAGSLIDQGKIDPAAAQDFVTMYNNLRPSDYSVEYGEEGTPSQVNIAESLTEPFGIPMGNIRGSIVRNPPDYNRMDRRSAAYQYLAPGSRADPSRQQEAAEVLFREAEASPEFREEALRIAPDAIQEALRSRDISRLPTYAPIIPAFTGGSISIPEGLPPNVPFPEDVTDLPIVETPVVAGPRGMAPRIPPPPEPQPEPAREPAQESSKDREARESREAASRAVKIHEATVSRIKEESKKAGEKKLQADDKKAIARANAAAERAQKKSDDLIKKQLDDMMQAAERQRNAERVLSTFVDPWAFEDRRGGRR
tara:strand:- start:4 stop:1359 length:1356 start_codon:yes stop_codon:yes gene_type:complete